MTDRDPVVVPQRVVRIAEEDLEISIENNVLTVAGEFRAEVEEEGVQYLVRERRAGMFRRSITLPARSRLRRCSSSRGARIVLPFSSTNNSAGMHVCYVLTYVDIHPSGYVRSCVCMLVVPHLFTTESSAVSVLSREPNPRSCPKP